MRPSNKPLDFWHIGVRQIVAASSFHPCDKMFKKSQKISLSLQIFFKVYINSSSSFLTYKINKK